MIPAGTSIDLVITGTDAILQWSPGPIDGRVERLLKGLTVTRSQVQTPSWVSTAAITGILTDTYAYTWTVTVQTLQDFPDISSVEDLMNDAIVSATSYTPIIGAPGFGQVSAAPGSSPSTVFDLGTGLGNLAGVINSLPGLVLVGGIALVLVYLFASGKASGRVGALVGV